MKGSLAEVWREGRVTRARVTPQEGSVAYRACVEGHGQARLNETDHDMPEVGAGIAIARALQDMGKQLEQVYLERTISKKEIDRKRVAKGKMPKYDEPSNEIPGTEQDALVFLELGEIALPVAVTEGDLDYFLDFLTRTAGGEVLLDSRS